MEYSDPDENILLEATYSRDSELTVPRPLQIIKRVDPLHDIRSRNTSESSRYSTSTDKSRGSVPSAPEDHLPLVVPRKRLVAGHTAPTKPILLPGEYRYRRTEDKSPSPYSDETTPKPRRPTSCESPARAIPDYLTSVPGLSTKASLLFLQGKRADISPLDEWKLSSSATTSRIPSSNCDISEEGATEHASGTWLLAPKITVTPERKALDEGVTTL